MIPIINKWFKEHFSLPLNSSMDTKIADFLALRDPWPYLNNLHAKKILKSERV